MNNEIIFNIEAIGSRKPTYTLSIEANKTINELYERILYDLEYEDRINLYLDNKILDNNNNKLRKIIKENEYEVNLCIEALEYEEREIEKFYNLTRGDDWYRNDNWLNKKKIRHINDEIILVFTIEDNSLW